MKATSLRELGPAILDADLTPIAEAFVVVGDALMVVGRVAAVLMLAGLVVLIGWYGVKKWKR